MKYLFLIITLLFSASGFSENNDKKLRLLTWDGLISPDVISAFEKETGVELEVSVYHDVEMRNDLLNNKFIRSYDLIITSLSGIQELKSKNLIENINFNSFSNYKFMKHELLSSFDYSEYSIVLNYTSLGLVYRKDKIKNPPESWKEFIQQSKTIYSGKISYPLSQYDAFNIIYFSEFGNNKDINMDKLFLSSTILDSLNEHISEYDFPDATENSPIMKGTTWIGATYNYHAKEMISKNENIGFYYPKEGTKMWSDAISILKNSTMKGYAYKFIDHLMSEDSAYSNFKYNGYSSLNKLNKYTSVINKVDNKDNKFLLPSEEVIKHTPHKYDNFISDKEFYFYRFAYQKHTNKGKK